MTDLLILGTDTDAGKTTFALLWLAAFSQEYEYWKPVETGDSDTERVRQLVPAAGVHAPLARVFALFPRAAWEVEGVARAAREQQAVLEAIRSCLAEAAAASRERERPEVRELLERDRRYVWHPYSSLREPDPPLVSVAAQD